MNENGAHGQDDTLSRLLRVEQLQLSQNNLNSSLLANLIISSILVFLLRPVIDQSTLLIWWLIVQTISVFRFIDILRFRRASPAPDAIKPWLNSFSIGTYLGAIAWAAAPIFLFPVESISHQALISFVLAGMTAGAGVTLSSLWRPVLAYLLLPLIRWLFSLRCRTQISAGLCA
ncbi:hypothetical protein MMIC_P0169 [Mariprofundus micogutta]|uniref:Diguanylate cyclase n=1 Tax=Mariprofundus micogutta TaxID=1921010 RepID=A0A1L8CK11_9PROT|nr:hypothetical protein [Mariprofundus micogutta]GAV19240.1 hypothetical protein MMIC_P0169 [Mariprofundus micogutta]